MSQQSPEQIVTRNSIQKFVLNIQSFLLLAALHPNLKVQADNKTTEVNRNGAQDIHTPPNSRLSLSFPISVAHE